MLIFKTRISTKLEFFITSPTTGKRQFQNDFIGTIEAWETFSSDRAIIAESVGLNHNFVSKRFFYGTEEISFSARNRFTTNLNDINSWSVSRTVLICEKFSEILFFLPNNRLTSKFCCGRGGVIARKWSTHTLLTFYLLLASALPINWSKKLLDPK